MVTPVRLTALSRATSLAYISRVYHRRRCAAERLGRRVSHLNGACVLRGALVLAIFCDDCLDSEGSSYHIYSPSVSPSTERVARAKTRRDSAVMNVLHTSKSEEKFERKTSSSSNSRSYRCVDIFDRLLNVSLAKDRFLNRKPKIRSKVKSSRLAPLFCHVSIL
jgi:hypothetical protein